MLLAAGLSLLSRGGRNGPRSFSRSSGRAPSRPLLIAAQVFATFAMGPAALDSNARFHPVSRGPTRPRRRGFAALIVLTLVAPE